MKDLIVSEDIIPIGEFKKQASSLFRRVKELGRPILITQNGSPVSVVIPPQEYDRIQEQARFIASVEAGLADVEAGRVLTEKEARERLEKHFGPLEP